MDAPTGKPPAPGGKVPDAPNGSASSASAGDSAGERNDAPMNDGGAPAGESAEAAPVVDVYSAGDRGFMQMSQRARAAFLGPVVRLLTAIRVRATHVTVLGLFVGLAFAPLLSHAPLVAVVCLLAHVLLDGLDGPLARHQERASPRGSFTDTFSDQLVVSAVGIALVDVGYASLYPAAAYVLAYGCVVVFSFVRNAMHIPYTWVIRPRFFVYAWIPVEVWLWPKTMDVVLWLFAGLLGVKVVSGFFRVRQAM